MEKEIKKTIEYLEYVKLASEIFITMTHKQRDADFQQGMIKGFEESIRLLKMLLENENKN